MPYRTFRCFSCRYAAALKSLDKLTGGDADKPAKRDLFERRAEYLAALGWRHWAKAEKDALRVRFPSSYPLP